MMGSGNMRGCGTASHRESRLAPAGMLLLCLLCLAALAGCGTSPKEPAAEESHVFCRLQDDAGREVVLERKPERIVVTSASFLEPLHAVGGAVVGRPDSRTRMPDYAKDVASVGQVYQIDMEKVLACQPDLVILNKGMNEKLADTLAGNGIPSMVLAMRSYEDVKREIGILSQVTGETGKGEALVREMEQGIRATIAKLPKERKRVAVLHSTAQGLSVQLDGSIAGNIVKLLGWENVAAGMEPMEKNPDAAPYSMETLVEQNPEILFVTSMGKLEEIRAGMEETIASNPAWQAIPAIRQGHVHYLPQDLFLLSPGLRYPEAVELMARLVYPEAFPQ